MSVVESELEKLIREFLAAHGEKQFDCMTRLRRYVHKTPFEQLRIETADLKTAGQLRVILGTGPPGDLYKACMARLYALESAR